MNWIDHDKPCVYPIDTAHLRKFGVVMAAAFGILSAAAWWSGSSVFPWVVSIATAFFVTGMLAPRFLARLEKGWMAFAEKLSIVMTILVLTLTFYVLITPIGLCRKLFARDSLGLSFDRNLSSYWKPVELDGPADRPDKPY